MCSTMGRAAVIALGGLWLIFGSACSNSPDAQSTCDAYARVFADVAANTCKRGTFDSNLAAFKASARVGSGHLRARQTDCSHGRRGRR